MNKEAKEINKNQIPKEENQKENVEKEEQTINKDECQCEKNSNSKEACCHQQDDNQKEEKCNCQDKKKDKKGIFNKKDKEIEELNNQIATLKDTLLRNQAELQNYKKRKDEETAKILKYKDEEIIKEFLPIVDNFERAIKMDDNDLTDEVSKFLSGIKIIYTNTLRMLEKFEVKEIPAEGLEFDPNYHHAVLTEHNENKPEGVILEVLQKGYIYKDRVVRASMVKVNE